MKKRKGLSKVAMLALVMVLALGGLGVGYAQWVDEVAITGELSTQDIDASLSCVSAYLTGTPAAPTTNSCSEGAPMTLNLEITNAQQDTDYYFEFDVYNGIDSLPLKISDLAVSDSWTGVVELIEDITVGTVIDPGMSATGKVHIYLETAASVEEDINVVLEVSVVRWNE